MKKQKKPMKLLRRGAIKKTHLMKLKKINRKLRKKRNEKPKKNLNTLKLEFSLIKFYISIS